MSGTDGSGGEADGGDRYGSLWANEFEWAARRTPSGCPICRSGGPFGSLGALHHVVVTAGVDAPVRGYLCVWSKRHVNEPFELADEELVGFWREAMAVARALHREYRPVKMNYEIHGNTLPHLHLHLFPRFADDAFVGRPVDGGEVHHHHDEAERERLARVVQAAASDRGGGAPTPPMGRGW